MGESHVYLNPESALLACHASDPSFDFLGNDGGCGRFKGLHLHPLVLVDGSCCGIESLRFWVSDQMSARILKAYGKLDEGSFVRAFTGTLFCHNVRAKFLEE